MSARDLLLGRDCPADCTCRGMASKYVPAPAGVIRRLESARDDMSESEYRVAVARALAAARNADI